MMGLTRTMRDCLAIIAELTEQGGGVAPSFTEIQREMDFASKSQVHRLVVALEDRGYVARAKGRSRGIGMLAEPMPLPDEPEFVGLFDDPALVAALARTA